MWFTSDLHFYHKRVIDFCARPWTNIEEMNAGLINNWNSVVGSEDLIYILGDICFCGPVKAEKIMEQLNGKKTIVLGNHDWGIKRNRWAQMSGVIDVLSSAEMLIDNKKVLLSHFPYTGDSTEEDRYLECRPIDESNWLLHGHVHMAWKVKDKMINVGVDQWDWKPVHIDQIVDIIK